MNAQQLATKARESISEFCMNECQAYCCRKGYLILSQEELTLLTADKQEELEREEFVKKLDDNLFSLNLGNHLGSCPQLQNSMCAIHTNPKRPSACQHFPVFVNEDNKEVRLSPRCLAVKENKLYSYTHEFIKLGFMVNKQE